MALIIIQEKIEQQSGQNIEQGSIIKPMTTLPRFVPKSKPHMAH